MNSSTSAARDVVVIGGGAIGLSIAWELARNGLSVRLLEQGPLGQEASWAGAGMLPPGNPRQAKTTEAKFRSNSHILWPEWSEQLRSITGIDNGFHRCGGVEVQPAGSRESLEDRITTWRDEGVTVESLTGANLRQRLPALNPEISSGYFLPELGQVRNPRHVKALIQACLSAGVDLRPGSPVIDIVRQRDKVTAVKTLSDEHLASEFVVASGAWSRTLLQRVDCDLAIEPIRGQMVLLNTPKVLFRHVIEVGPRYLVPRPDGRVLIGATEEQAGFEKRTTAAAIAGLIDFGRGLIPALGEAQLERCWAGLRPYAPGGLPRIGRVPGITNLSLAAGHFRAGLQLSPMTAVLVRQLLLNQHENDWAADLAIRSTT